MNRAFLSFAMGIAKAMLQNYCEHDKMFIFINSPFYFKFAMAIFKPLLSKRQIEKFCIAGDMKKPEGKDMLTKHIGSSCALKCYGGDLEALPGYFPPPGEEEKDEWYQTRHLLPVELAVEGSSHTELPSLLHSDKGRTQIGKACDVTDAKHVPHHPGAEEIEV